MTARTIGVAIGIPDPWAAELDRSRRGSGDPLAALIPPHVTLLGPTVVHDPDAVLAHLRGVAARHAPFPLHLRGTGTFRPVTDVVFVAVATGHAECELLEKDIRTGPLGRDLRYPYHPHVTVAHDVGVERLDEAYERLSGFDARFRVDRFTVFEHGTDGRWRPWQDFPFPDVDRG